MFNQYLPDSAVGQVSSNYPDQERDRDRERERYAVPSTDRSGEQREERFKRSGDSGRDREKERDTTMSVEELTARLHDVTRGRNTR